MVLASLTSCFTKHYDSPVIAEEILKIASFIYSECSSCDIISFLSHILRYPLSTSSLDITCSLLHSCLFSLSFPIINLSSLLYYLMSQSLSESNRKSLSLLFTIPTSFRSFSFSFRSFLRASLDLSLRQRVLRIPLRIGVPFKGEQSLATLGFALRLRRIRVSKPRDHQANRSNRTEPSSRAAGNAQAIQSRIDSDVQRAITRRRSAQSLENRLSGDESIRRHAVFRIDSPVSHRILSIQRPHRFVSQRSPIEASRPSCLGPFEAPIAVVVAAFAHRRAPTHLRREAERASDVAHAPLQPILEGRSARSAVHRGHSARAEVDFDRTSEQNRSVGAVGDDQSARFALFSSNRGGAASLRCVDAAKHRRIHPADPRILSDPRRAAHERQLHSDRRRRRNDASLNDFPPLQNVFRAQTARLFPHTRLFPQSPKPDVYFFPALSSVARWRGPIEVRRAWSHVCHDILKSRSAHSSMMRQLSQWIASLQDRLRYPLDADVIGDFQSVTDYLCELLKEEIGLLRDCEAALKLIGPLLQCVASLACVDELYPIVLRSHVFVHCMLLCRRSLDAELRATLLRFLLACSSHPEWFEASVRQGLLAMIVAMRERVQERREVGLFLFVCSVLVRYSEIGSGRSDG